MTGHIAPCRYCGRKTDVSDPETENLCQWCLGGNIAAAVLNTVLGDRWEVDRAPFLVQAELHPLRPLLAENCHC